MIVVRSVLEVSAQASTLPAELGAGVAPEVGVLLATAPDGATLGLAVETGADGATLGPAVEVEPDGATLALAVEVEPDGATLAVAVGELFPQAAIPPADSSITARNAVMLLLGVNPA